MKRSVKIEFTKAELSALLNVATYATQNGLQLEGPAQWALDRIYRTWTEWVDEESAAKGDPNETES